MKVNIPTRLTLFRILAVPPFLVLITFDLVWCRFAALLLFVVASISDYYDGKMARKLGEVTTLGKFLDPLADKLLIAAPLIVFVQIPEVNVPAWMVVVIIAREFLITGLRTLAASQNVVLPAQPAGKFKTTSQLVTIITILTFLTWNAVLEQYFGIPRGSLLHLSGSAGAVGWILFYGPLILVSMTAAFTVISGYIYIHDNRAVLHASKSRAR